MKKELYQVYNGKEIYKYTLENEFLEISILNIGARIHEIKVKNKNNIDICLGYNTCEEYIKSNTYCGATIGRNANRIRNGKFEINGKEYQLTINDGNNQLHGGIEGFDVKIFTPTIISGNEISFNYLSEDMEEGFPGNLTLDVDFKLEGNELLVTYKATTDEDTIWAPTNHTYFNLNGCEYDGIHDTLLKLNCSKYLLSDDEIIPTGETKDVENTPFDYKEYSKIGLYTLKGFEYDHAYLVDGTHMASCIGEKSNVRVDVYSDLPSIQFYSGNFLKGIGKGKEYLKYDGFCLEPQLVPNAVNMLEFESPIIKKGEIKTHYIKYVIE